MSDPQALLDLPIPLRLTSLDLVVQWRSDPTYVKALFSGQKDCGPAGLLPALLWLTDELGFVWSQRDAIYEPATLPLNVCQHLATRYGVRPEIDSLCHAARGGRLELMKFIVDQNVDLLDEPRLRDLWRSTLLRFDRISLFSPPQPPPFAFHPLLVAPQVVRLGGSSLLFPLSVVRPSPFPFSLKRLAPLPA